MLRKLLLLTRQRSSIDAEPMDPWLLFAALALCALGLVMVFSSGSWLGHSMYEQWDYFLRRQGIFAIGGITGMLVLSQIDYRLLRRFAPQIMIGSLLLLVLVLVVGNEINGARRWISFGGVNLQPSEVAKLTLAAFLSAMLARQGERIRSFKRGFLPVMLVSGLTMLLVLLEKDLGTTLLLGALTLIMLFIAGTRLSYVLAVVMLAAPIIWQQIVGVEYRRGRLEAFLSGDSYQVHQALISIGSGGMWGLGLGKGKQKLGFLPENHTDFILASIGEELGLVGIYLAIGLIGLLVARGLVIAHRASDRFGTYLAVGLSSMFGLQALINMAVVLEVVPAKGITLPFLSYGGSSLLASMAAVGILLNISRRAPPWRWSDERRDQSARRGTKKPKAAVPSNRRAATQS